MKRITLFAACALVVVVLAGLVWFVSRAAAPATPRDADVAATHSPTTPTTELDAARASVVEADPAREVDEPTTDDVAGRSAAPDAARALVVRGRVRAGSALCEDPTLEVLACKTATDREAVADWMAPSDEQAPPSSRVLARAPVAADGTFEIALAEGTQRAHFTVSGRYLYRGDSLEVNVGGSAPWVELEVQAGSWILGELELPLGTSVTTADLDGTPVRLRTSVESFVGGGDPTESVSRRSRCKDGRFEFRAIPAAGNYRVVIEPEKLAACELRETELVACRSKTLRIPLQRGGTIRGIVRAQDQSPVAEAEVEASVAGLWFGFDNRDVRSAKSRADGTFELAAVTPGDVVLTATKDGMLDSEQVKLELADDGLTSGVEVLLSAGNSISGRVTFADGTPASAAQVNVTFDMSQMFGMNAFNATRGARGKVTTGSDGTFAVWGLGQGPFTVQAEGWPLDAPTDLLDREREKHKARMDGVAPNTKGFELVLHAPIGLSGRVVDADGAPVTKFRLYAVRPSDGLMGNIGQESHEESFEAQDGHFLMTGLETGKWEFFAIAEGFAYPDPFAVTLPRDDADAEVVITLVRGAVVNGRVRASNGAPFAGASVEIDTGEPTWKTRVLQGPKKPGATSADNGVFRLENLRAGHVTLVADAKQHAQSLPIEVDLVAGGEVSDVELLLRAGGTLTGEVFDDSGEPATGLMVQVTVPQDFEQQMSFSDGAGKFKFEHLEPASWQVVAMPTSLFSSAPKSDDATSDNDVAMSMFSKMKMAMVDIKEGEETHVVLGAPPTDPVKVFGRVTHNGEPFTGALVIFYSEGKASLSGMKSSQVDKDGNYSVVLNSAGSYLASVQKFAGSMQQQSVVEFSCDIPSAKEHRLDFAMPTARISGRIRDANGDAAKGARVSLHPETALEGGTMWGGQYNELSADDDGRFDIQALRPGRYTLLVGGMAFGGLFGDEAHVLGREVRGGISLSEGEWMRDVDFRLKTPGSLEVTVVDAAGALMSEAAVFVRTEGGELVDRFSMVSTDSSGTAVYGGLSPGRYTATARKGALVAPESARILVEAGVKTPAKIVLAGGTTIVVTLVGEPEQPLKPSVSVTDEEGRELGAMLGLAELMKLFSEGGLSTTERRFGPFPPGRYKIQGTANGKTVTKTVQLTGQAERKLTLRFND